MAARRQGATNEQEQQQCPACVAGEVEDEGVPFEEKMTELTVKLYEQFAKADQLEATIRKNLEGLGYSE